MKTAPFIRHLLKPFRLPYNKILAAFPVAVEAGAFLRDPLPDVLGIYQTNSEPTLAQPTWQLVTSKQYRESAHLAWCEAMRVAPALNRKQWEWVYILQVLKQRGMLTEGVRGLGFGCGNEPLSALIASMGCTIVATDLAPGDAARSGWIAANQHATSLEGLNAEKLCDPELFANQVTLQSCDMNNIVPNLRGFDFLWSSCALEHLGSLEHGLRFMEKAMDCLRPGGVAVHTTEFNLGSNGATLESSATCVYRRKDVEELAMRLLAQGHRISKINFASGNELPDLYVDLPPYRSAVHLRLINKRHLCTSLGLFVEKHAPDLSTEV